MLIIVITFHWQSEKVDYDTRYLHYSYIMKSYKGITEIQLQLHLSKLHFSDIPPYLTLGHEIKIICHENSLIYVNFCITIFLKISSQPSRYSISI